MDRGPCLIILRALFLLACLGLPLSLLAQAPLGKERVDLLITGGTVVTMDSGKRTLEGGAIAVRGDTIVALGSAAEVESRYAPARRISASGRLILPGLINGHTHAAMTLFRGIADDMELQDWLTKFIFPAEARNVTPDFVTWGTRLGLLEMIRGGTTTYVDMYYFEDQVAQATKQAGMRAILGETVIDFPAPDNKTPAQALMYAENFISHWTGDTLVRAAVAPHAIYTVSEPNLRASAALARRRGAPILIHVSETKRELDDSRAKRCIARGLPGAHRRPGPRSHRGALRLGGCRGYSIVGAAWRRMRTQSFIQHDAGERSRSHRWSAGRRRCCGPGHRWPRRQQ